MPTKTPLVVSSVLTVIFLILFGLVLTFGQLVMLNGFSEREGNSILYHRLYLSGSGDNSLCHSCVVADQTPRPKIQLEQGAVGDHFGCCHDGSRQGLAFVSLLVSIGVAEAMWQAR